ncbi:myosin-cross-reactive antigen family protein [Penicillium nucicola]|uniref:myosin-cross-reactive antigen family protein n=1 Tax=Penicillium nucicola TaxID=1850975 RepID=UPI002545A400|nr:myosin-cross-reactive antigen family protein [Penicillium nucicola]KAJ5748306.1 myosin-cross-reactive antigen family protein [Penicillium nucicola]
MVSRLNSLQIEPTCTDDMEIWILGSGIASLTSAVHLIKDAKIAPSRIHIIERLEKAGGGSASTGDPINGYDYRAGAMPAFNNIYMEKLLSIVPSKSNPKRTTLDDICEFSRSKPPHKSPNTRILSRKASGLARTGPNQMGVGLRDRIALYMLSSKTEKALGRSRIQDHFHANFFQSNYWLILSTTFGFGPCHSAAEFRRYVHWFKNGKHELNHLRPLDNGQYNRHESIIVPVAQFLRSRGVDFRFGTTVTDIILEPGSNGRVSSIRATKGNSPEMTIDVGLNDVVIVSLGSVISGATSGTNTEPPYLEIRCPEKDLDENWLLWLELSTKDTKFGNAYNFCTRMGESRQESFTVTLKSPEFFDRFVELTGDAPGSGVFVTLKDSPWLLSLKIPDQPMFPDQPADIQVFWGFAEFPERKGNFIEKPMLECSGKEIMTEILYNLQFPLQPILNDSITIPCVAPRMAAPFLPREDGDRPPVIPEGMTNVALIGQFVDIPDQIVGTMDYYVRGAQIAVRQLMGLDRDATLKDDFCN